MLWIDCILWQPFIADSLRLDVLSGYRHIEIQLFWKRDVETLNPLGLHPLNPAIFTPYPEPDLWMLSYLTASCYALNQLDPVDGFHRILQLILHDSMFLVDVHHNYCCKRWHYNRWMLNSNPKQAPNPHTTRPCILVTEVPVPRYVPVHHMHVWELSWGCKNNDSTGSHPSQRLLQTMAQWSMDAEKWPQTKHQNHRKQFNASLQWKYVQVHHMHVQELFWGFKSHNVTRSNNWSDHMITS